MHPARSLTACTVRIVAGSEATGPSSIGTGFLYSFPIPITAQRPDPGKHVPALITNKHVLEGCDTVEVFLTSAMRDAPVNELGVPIGSTTESYRLNISNATVRHPSPDIDLCAVNLSEIFNHVERSGRVLAHIHLHRGVHADATARKLIRPVESILMVGYPSGIWDSVNNAPLTRRGISATHPLARYEGRPEFVIDAACFPGSSGSPVFWYEDGMFRSGEDMYSPGTRIALLGVLYAGPQFTAEGKVQPKPIPHSLNQLAVISIPMNLGFVIHADEIDAIGQVFLSAISG
jgi:hypothetical protein